MKYREPKTGEVFVDIFVARERFCEGKDCNACVMPNVCRENLPPDSWNCADFAEKHPAEAARLMGLEVVEGESAAGETLDRKPPICEILGGKDNPLEIGEVFTIKGYPNREYRYAVIYTDGKLHNYLEEPCQTTGTRVGNKIGVNTLYWLFDHPEAIIRKPRFTEEEVADAKALMRILGATGIERSEYGGNLCAFIGEIAKVVIEPDLFPSLRPGQAVALGEILGRL